MFQVITEFEDMNVAIKATELFSTAFPMLNFQLMEVPELDLSSSNFTQADWLNFVSKNNPSDSGKSYNDIIKERFNNA